MRTPGRIPVHSVALTVTIAAVGLFLGAGAVRGQQDPAPDPTPTANAPSCDNSCRGLGIEKVKAGDEHCGLIPREIKDEALDAACGLAESHREMLRQRAEERAREKCAEQDDQTACLCRTELRPWQNVYTHVLSQNCWTECGWAFLIECGRRPTANDG